MLVAFLTEQSNKQQSLYLATYTRNPSILQIVSSAASPVYPLTNDEALRQVALAMDGAEHGDDGAVYHVNRYPEGGLHGKEDPAGRYVKDSDVALKDQFPGLVNMRSALIVTARLPEKN